MKDPLSVIVGDSVGAGKGRRETEGWRDAGRVVQARRGEDDQWRVAWTDPKRDVFPDERDVWVGWMRVVFPPAKRGERR